MGGFFAVVLLLALAGVVLGVVRWAGFAVSGKLKPLSTRFGPDDPVGRSPVVFVAGNGPASPPADTLDRIREDLCELHRKAFCAVTIFRLIRPSSSLDVAPANGLDVRGRCFLLSCADCVTEARRWRAFLWRRDNQAHHPQWASAALYPYLLKSLYFEIDDEVATPMSGLALPPASSSVDETHMAGLMPKLHDLKACGDEVSVVPELSPDALRCVLRSVNKKPQGQSLLLADAVVAIAKGLESLAITTDGLYEVSAGWESIRRTSYEAMNDVTLSPDSSDVLVNGRKLFNPFFKHDRRRRFASALHPVLVQMRTIAQSHVSRCDDMDRLTLACCRRRRGSPWGPPRLTPVVSLQNGSSQCVPSSRSSA